jgi:hypothetical protein
MKRIWIALLALNSACFMSGYEARSDAAVTPPPAPPATTQDASGVRVSDGSAGPSDAGMLYDAGMVPPVAQKCTSGDSCDFNCDGGTSCPITCSAGSSCTIACPGPNGCTGVVCEHDAGCIATCPDILDASTCGMTCSGVASTCGATVRCGIGCY